MTLPGPPFASWHSVKQLGALTSACRRWLRAIKYSIFPPLALATLAGYLSDDDEVTIQDEHVERLDVSDEPDLVAIDVYITSAYRAYELGDHYRRRGAHVALGGLHQRLAAQGRITAANWDLYS